MIFWPLILIFGLAVGSFLNVVIYRLETEEKLINSRSHCLHCGKILAWYDLVPVVSFLMLRGRCRSCKKPISWQYPAIETITGLLFLLIFNFQFPIFNEFSIFNVQYIELAGLFYKWFIASCLLVVFVYDFKYYIIPDKIVFSAVGAAFLWQVFLAFNFAALRSGNNLFPELVEGFRILFPYFFSALGAAAFFLALVFITRGRGMGLGDVKLVFLMGLILGWPDILAALFFAFFIGALVGLILIILGRKNMRSEIPFGPFLAAATFLIMLAGQNIIGWYFNLFGF